MLSLARKFRWTLSLAAIPALESLTATILFQIQGGFGGGHGNYDFLIYYLQLPGFLIIEKMPDLGFFWEFRLLLDLVFTVYYQLA